MRLFSIFLKMYMFFLLIIPIFDISDRKKYKIDTRKTALKLKCNHAIIEGLLLAFVITQRTAPFFQLKYKEIVKITSFSIKSQWSYLFYNAKFKFNVKVLDIKFLHVICFPFFIIYSQFSSAF